ncbi:hypothetical protein BDW60DRAFT_208462 [Aspergillus nidulans var. acristatus]
MHMLFNPALTGLGALAATLLIPAISAAPSGSCDVGETWRDWKDCHGFYECAFGGIPIRKVCGHGTAYSPHTSVCDYEWKVPTCHHYYGHGHDRSWEEKGRHYGHGGDKEDHQGHWGGNKEGNHSWKQGYRMDASGGREDEDKCYVGSAWPGKVDCRKFWECAAGGIPVCKSCGPGTAYSPELGVCDYEWKVQSCRRHEHNNKWSGHAKGEDSQKDDEGDDKKWQHDEPSGNDDHWVEHGQDNEKEDTKNWQHDESSGNDSRQWAEQGRNDDKEGEEKWQHDQSSDGGERQ